MGSTFLYNGEQVRLQRETAQELAFWAYSIARVTLGVHPGDAVKISGNGVRQEAETQRLFELKGS